MAEPEHRQRILKRVFEPEFQKNFLTLYKNEAEQSKATELVAKTVHDEMGLNMHPTLFSLIVQDRSQREETRKIREILASREQHLEHINKFSEELAWFATAVFAESAGKPHLSEFRHTFLNAIEPLQMKMAILLGELKKSGREK